MAADLTLPPIALTPQTRYNRCDRPAAEPAIIAGFFFLRYLSEMISVEELVRPNSSGAYCNCTCPGGHK